MSTTVTKCPFKSHKKLGLKQREWEALIKTLLLMEADAIVHVTDYEQPHTSRPLFNMSDWNQKYRCGTVACIGGSAEIFGKLEPDSMEDAAYRLYEGGDPNLRNLFYEWGGGNPTPQQAAKVLRGYLTTGKTDWEKVMGPGE